MFSPSYLRRFPPSRWTVTWLLCILVIADGCSGHSEDEVSRVTSPAGGMEAVLTELNGGATTSFGYDVYITRKGDKNLRSPIASLYGATRNDNAYGANLIWQSNADLRVEYQQALSTKLIAPSVSIAGQEVRVTLVPGQIDNNAAPGGMLYNLRGRE